MIPQLPLGILTGLLLATSLGAADDAYLGWDAKYASQVVLGRRVDGRVGPALDFRVLSTDRSFNYKLRATWMTPEVIRASARLQQFIRALSPAETRKLVADAEAIEGTVVLVEIDPREGSGVIPRDWVSTFGPAGPAGSAPLFVRGVEKPELRELPALAGGARRDYAYEVFWVVFPSKNDEGKLLFGPADKEAELSIRIHDKLGKVRWPVTDALPVKR